MSYDFCITESEKTYLRELARKQLEYANLPVMEERRKLWYSHNSLKGERPVIVMEMDTFANDILPAPICVSPAAVEIENNLNRFIVNHELIDDDKVIPDYYTIYWKIDIKEFGLKFEIAHAKDSNGRELGYKIQYPIQDLEKDFQMLKPSTYSVDREFTIAWKNFVSEIIGDILPVKLKNRSLNWYPAPSGKVVKLMGLENMMFAMADYPDEVHALYKFLVDDIISFVRWQEMEGLLLLNNENDYAGAGSYGFTDELPSNECRKSGLITSKDLWCNMNSQETVGISPAMYEEYAFPYYYDLAKEFGLAYYGCCEPVHSIWENCISKLPGLRKVSISPWCDEEYMSRALKGSNVIYSRKPSPNYVGVYEHFDEAEFSNHMAKTIELARGCSLEIIFRDIYTLMGEKTRAGRAVKITRQLIDRIW